MGAHPESIVRELTQSSLLRKRITENHVSRVLVRIAPAGRGHFALTRRATGEKNVGRNNIWVIPSAPAVNFEGKRSVRGKPSAKTKAACRIAQ